MLPFVGFLLLGLPLTAGVAALVLLKVEYFSEVRVVAPWFLFPSLGLSSGCWNLFLVATLARRPPAGFAAILFLVGGVVMGVVAAALNFRRFSEARIVGLGDGVGAKS